MKGLTKRLLALVICAAVFAGCGNPWMKRITASLYDKPETPGIPEVPAIVLLTSIEEVAAWIDEQTALGRGGPADPIPLPPLAIAGDFGVYWPALLQTIADKGAYVELDLTYCGMGGVIPAGEFDPGTGACKYFCVNGKS